jgi:AcrR family transcriptional regulator
MVELPTHLRGAPMGTETLSRADLATHQRDRVLSKAIPVFARRGYLGTSVDDLLATAKVGVGNFYSLFEGKEDCFLAAFESISASGRERVLAAAEPGRSWAERAVLGLREFLSVVLADRLAARVVLIEAQAAGAEATRRYEALLESATVWLQAGRAGLPEADGLPPTFERTAVAGLAYYLQQCLFNGEFPELGELLEEVSAVTLAPLVGAEELRRLIAASTSG